MTCTNISGRLLIFGRFELKPGEVLTNIVMTDAELASARELAALGLVTIGGIDSEGSRCLNDVHLYTIEPDLVYVNRS